MGVGGPGLARSGPSPQRPSWWWSRWSPVWSTILTIGPRYVGESVRPGKPVSHRVHGHPPQRVRPQECTFGHLPRKRNEPSKPGAPESVATPSRWPTVSTNVATAHRRLWSSRSGIDDRAGEHAHRRCVAFARL